MPVAQIRDRRSERHGRSASGRRPDNRHGLRAALLDVRSSCHGDVRPHAHRSGGLACIPPGSGW